MGTMLPAMKPKTGEIAGLRRNESSGSSMSTGRKMVIHASMMTAPVYKPIRNA
jgi:hypothetical protein